MSFGQQLAEGMRIKGLDYRTLAKLVGVSHGYLWQLVNAEKRAVNDITTPRIIIYAVRPYHWKDQFPRVNTVSKDYAAEVEKKWAAKLPFLKK